MRRRVLITGFEPYGDWSSNPSADVASALHEHQSTTLTITSAVLPVVLENLRARIEALLDAHAPDVVICLGLHPGAATLRVERVGLNVADFVRPDNAGEQTRNAELVAGAPHALPASIPVHSIGASQLERGIPATVSNSAGTYLCNAALYQSLHIAAARTAEPLCGFIHLPFSPAQVARLMGGGASDSASGAAPGQDAIASMHITDMCEGVRIAAEIAAAAVCSTSEQMTHA